MGSLRHLRLIGIALAVLGLGGAAGFHDIEGWPWFDGLYMVVVTTFTTLGYQEVHPLSHAGRMFNLARIVAGGLLVFLGNRVADPSFARIRARQILRQAQHGTRDRPAFRPLHHLRSWPGWPQRRPRTVAPAGPVRSEEMRFHPSPRDRTELGDFLIAMGQPSQLRRPEPMASPS